jgi:hypothetical protein
LGNFPAVLRTVHRLHLRVYGVNQGVDIAITESIGLKLAGIIRMTRHMIGARSTD